MTPASLRILVVEDELLIRWSVSEVLAASGHVVAEAGRASEARSALMTGEPFDVVLLDLRLPDCADFTLLSEIGRLAPAATIVVMTAYGSPEITTEGLRLGARVVLDKPFDMATLEPALRRAHDGGPAGLAPSAPNDGENPTGPLVFSLPGHDVTPGASPARATVKGGEETNP
jgi:DNA-binding NtrC family response regulator